MARPANAVTSNSNPPTIARTGDNSVYQSSYQNPGFYAQGRYWVFYEDSSSTCEHQAGCLFYVWSVNGATLWSTPVNVGVHVTDNDWSVVTDGTSAYYARYNETSFDSTANRALLFGMGQLGNTGVINWQPEQVVLSAGSAMKFPNDVIGVDSNGQVWVGYQQDNSGTKTPHIVHSNSTLPPQPLSTGLAVNASDPTIFQNVMFNATATGGNWGGTSSYAFSWNFGDGSTATGQIVTHQYTFPGNYSVTLNTADSGNPQQTAISAQTVPVGLLLPSTNTPPALQVPVSRSIKTGTFVSFTVTSSDNDGDTVTLSSSSLPVGASFNPGTGLFTWTPTPDQSNQFWPISFTATDNATLSVMKQVLIYVSPSWSGDSLLSTSGNKGNWHVDIATLATGGQVYAAYWVEGNPIFGRLFSNTVWGVEEDLWGPSSPPSTDVNSFIFATGSGVSAIYYDTNVGKLYSSSRGTFGGWGSNVISPGDAKSAGTLGRYSLPFTAAYDQGDSRFYVFWYNQANNTIDEFSGADTTWLKTEGAFSTHSSASGSTIGSYHYSTSVGGKNAFGIMWIDGTGSPYNLNFGLETVGPLSSPTTDSSWNPRVSCTASVVTIEQILGNQNNSFGGATESGSIFNPGILAKSPGDAKRWLAPPCAMTNADGQVVSAFVEIVGVQRGFLLNEDYSVHFDPVNGGGPYPNGMNTSDTTFNIFTPGYNDASGHGCSNINATGCMHTIHLEFDHDWKAAGYCGPNTVCDPYQMAAQSAVGKTLLDVQGFIYWDPEHADDASHGYSGWELHPLAGWRLHGVSSFFTLSANPAKLTIIPGGSSKSNITINASNVWQSFPLSMTAKVFPAGPTLTMTPATATVPSCNQCSIAFSILNITTTQADSGTYIVTVTGGTGAAARSVNVTALVEGFTISASPASLSIQAGSTSASIITLTSVSGFSGTVNLANAVSGCGCFTSQLNSTSVVVPSGGTKTVALTVNATSTTGNEVITVTGTAPTISFSASTTISVTSVDFAANAAKSVLTLNAGFSNATSITLGSVNGFSGTVALTATSNSTNLSSSLSAPSVTLQASGPGSTASVVVTVNGTKTGNYLITITATSGSLTHKITITVKVVDFSIASAASIQVNVGSSGSTTINLASLNGFAGTVSLTNSTIPSGIIASLTSRSVLLSPNGSTSVILTVFSTTVTNYTLTITGTSGTLVHTIHITVNVVDFTIAASSVTPTSINAGSTGNSTITITGLNGYAKIVNLSVSAPSEIACSLSPTKLNLPPSPATSILSCLSSTPNDYTVTVTGTNGTLSHTTANILFHIVDFTITPSLSSLSLVVGQSQQTTVSLVGSNRFVGNVNLNVLIAPSSPSATFSPSSVTLKSTGCACGSSILGINAGLTAGLYTLNVTGTNAALTHWVIINLTVTKDNPSITTNLSSTTIVAGASVTDSSSMTGATSTASGTVTYLLFANGACTAPGNIISIVTVTNNLIPNSRAVVLNATGSYSFNATYSGDNNNEPASSPCEPLVVQKDNPTIATSLSLTSIQVGQSVIDSAILSSFFQASGIVNYNLFVGSSICAGSSFTVSTVTISNGAIPSSRSVTFNSTNPGGYSFQASYSGDTNNIGVTSSCEPLAVTPVGVTITTSLSAPTITVGGTVTDTSILHGQTSAAGGTVTYNVFVNSNCAASATVVSIVTVSNGVVPNSRTVTFNSSGTFSFNAIYSGDNNNNGGTSSCEPLTVNKAFLNISTTVNPSSTIIVGASITDQATLTGGFPSTGVTGTVTYALFSFSILPSATAPCSGGTIVGTPQTVNVNVGNSVPASNPITPQSPGFYGFSAVYNGNGNNTAATGNCEPLTVNNQTPTITTTINPSSSIVVGATATDQATITGGFPSTGVSGTVTYRFFGPGNGVCSGTPVSSHVVNVGAGNSVSPSNPQSPSAAGQYSFNATYSGDSNNNQVTSSCELLTVNLVSTTTIIVCGSSVTVGVPTSCTIIVSDVAPGTLTPTGTVNLSTNSSGTFSPPSPCTLSGTTSSASCTVTYTPLVLGAHNITATYTGDNKHGTSAGFVVLSPGKHSTSTSISCSSPILVNQDSTCTATVTDTSTLGATTPSGSVSFTETGVTGNFNVTTCTLIGTGSTVSCGVKFTPSAPGTASMVGSYSGDSTHSGSSNGGSPAQVAVNQLITVSVPFATPSAIDSGQSVTLSTTFSGGTSPFVCQWLQKAPGASSYSGLDSSSPCTSPVSISSGILTTVGSWSFELQVTDSSSSPSSLTSGPVGVAVNAALSLPTISASPIALDLGQSSTVATTTSFSGGTAPYVCQWLEKSPGATSYTSLGSSFSCIVGDKPTASTGVLSTAGSWSFEFRVTDAGSPSELVSSAAVSVTVNPTLTPPVISANPLTVNAGQSVTLSTPTSFGSGTPTYVCHWLQKAPGASTYANLGTSFACSAGDKPSTSTGVLSTTGAWSFELQVNDSGSPFELVSSNAAAVTVNGVLSSGAISPSTPTIDAGQSITLTSNPSGGTAPYSYQWYSDGACITVIATATTSTFTASPSVTSIYSVKVADSASSSQCSASDTVTVNPALLQGAVSPSAPTIDTGQSITLGANSSGGTAPYHYQWYSGASVSCSSDTTLLGTTATQVVSPAANTYFCYIVTDSAFAPATQSSAADLVTVDPTLVAGPISPLGPTIDSGQSVALISNPSGGTSPYSYQWYAAASCTSGSLISGAISSAYTASPPSTTNYFYKVTDSSQGSPSASQCSPGDLVTVNPALVVGAITPSNPTIDSGQSITLTSHTSGGTLSVSYQWYSDGSCTTAISGATSPTYSPSPTSSSTYSYKVTDSAFSPTSQCSTGDTVAVSSVLVAGAITPAGPAINGGQTITLTANPSGGTTPYNYRWYSDGTCSNPISSATSSTYSASPSVTTTYSYKVTDSAFSTVSQCASGDTVTVNSAIVAGAITPPNPTIDSGQAITLTSHVSGGTPSFSYQWYSDGICGTAISGAASPTFTFSSSATTNYSYKVTDSAQSPASACSPVDTVTVDPALITGPVTPSAPTIDAGQSITLTSHASGGTPSISYQWYSDGTCSLAITGATSPTYATAPSVTTTYAYLVTDSAYSPVSQCSPADVIAVSPALVAGAITPSAPAINNGQSIILSAHPSGGTAPYSYQWYSAANCQTGSLIPGITSAAYSASPTSTTTYSYKATDSSQGSPIASSCSPGNTVTVNGALSAGAISPSAPTINSGQSITLTANPSSGTAPYSYQWYSDGACTTAIPSAVSSAYNASPAVTATYSVKVTDSASASQCSPSNTVTVNPALAAGAITPSSPTIDIGQSITLTASPSAGTTPYAYQWYSATSCPSGNLISGATGSTLVTSPTSTTTYSYRVTDSSQGSPAASTCSAGIVVTVSPSLVAGAITPASPTIDNGQSITLASAASGGTTPYSYQWFTGGACTTLTPAAASSSYTASPASATTYSYRVTDSANSPVSVCSSGNTVTVNSALIAGAITPPAPKINSGQTITLTASPSAGTSPYTYQWFSGSSGTCSSDTTLLGTSITQITSPTASTYYCYTVTDSAVTHASQSSATDLVTVDPTLVAGIITPPNPAIDSGQSVTLTANPSGGTAPYSYQWYSGTSPSCSSDTAPLGTSSTQTVSSSSSAYYCYKVTDSSSGNPASSASSSTDLVTVNAALAIPSLTLASPIDSGQSTSIAVSWSGGTSPYAVTLYVSSSSNTCTGLVQVEQNTGVSDATTSFTVSPPTTTSYCASVTDSAFSPVILQTTSSRTVVVNPMLIVNAPSATPSSLDNGQSSALSSTFSGGSSPYTCQWLQKTPGASSYTSLGSSSLCTSPASMSSGPMMTVGTWSFELQMSDSGSPSVLLTSNAVTVSVNPPLTAAVVSANPTVINTGQIATLATSTSFSGGTAPYTCQWLKKGPLDSSYANFGGSLSCNVGDKPTVSTGTLSTSGLWSFELQITDSGLPSQIVASNAANITVNGALSAGAVSPGAPAIDAGQSITLNANAAGGTLPYSYQWYSDGTCATTILSATSSSYPTSPTVTSTYSYKVTDSASSSQCSPGDTVTVNPALVVGAVIPSAPTLDSGQSITLTASPSGGTAPYHYQWYSGASAACISDTSLLGTSVTQVTSPTVSTYYCYAVTDFAFAPATQSSATDLVTVEATLVSGSITPSGPNIDSSQSVTLTSNPSGGTAPYSYQWYSAASCPSGSLISGASLSTYAATPASTTSYSYKVTDSSQGAPRASQCSPADLVTVSPALVVGAVTPFAPTIDSGQAITFTSHASGGTPSLSYQWYSDGACTTAISGATSSTFSASPGSTSIYSYKVTDSAFSPTSQCSTGDTVAVNPALVAGGITPSGPMINAGQSITLTANPSGGTLSYNYQWYSDGICNSLVASATSSTYSASPTVTTTYSYRVTDAAFSPVSRCSPGDTVTVNSAIVAGAITPPNPTIDNGQSIVLTSHVSGGTPSFSYQWYSDGICGTAIPSATSPTFTSSTSATGSYSYKVTDSAQSPASACSPAETVTVNPALTAGPVTPSAPTIDAGQSITLTSHASGGTPSISYRWYADGTCSLAISGATSSTYVTTPSVTTTYAYLVTDSAYLPNSQCSGANVVTVNSALVAGGVTPSAPTINTGQSIALNVNPSGGTTPYTYQWYSAANCQSGSLISGASSSTYSASPTSTTTYSYKTTDSSEGSPVTSSCSPGDTVTVNGVLSAGAISPNAPTIDSGQSIALTASPSSGSAPYSYQWYSDGTCTTAISAATSSSYNTSPTATATYSYKVTDFASASQCSPGDIVTVNPTLAAGPITPTSPTLDSGQSITLSAAPSAGTLPYSYQWFAAASCASGTQVSGAISSTLVASPSSTTTYSYRVMDSSIGSPAASACSSGEVVTVSPSLVAGAITPSGPTIDNGQSILLASAASGGTTSYSYQWFTGGTCTTAILSATSSTYNASPASSTTYSYRVTDSASLPVSRCSSGNTVTVNSALAAGAITPASPKINSGQSITLIASPSGGTTPYTYQWYSGASASCSSDTTPLGAASTQVVLPTANTYYCYNVTDSAFSPASQSSITDLVTIDPVLVAGPITPLGAAIDIGQSITLTANPSGGTVPYSYQWYSGTSPDCSSDTAPLGTSSTQVVSSSSSAYYCYRVTDSSPGNPATSATSPTDLVTVNPVLAISPLTTTSPIDSGQSTSITVSWSGGTSPYTLTLFTSSSSSSCAGLIQVGQNTAVTGTTASFTQSPTTTTSYCASITDGASSPATIRTTSPSSVVVNPALLVNNPTATSSALDSGQQSTMSSTFTGGTLPYACQWLQKAPGSTTYSNLGSSSTCSSPTSSSTGVLATVGSWSFELQITDNGSPSVILTSNSITITVNLPLTPTAITANPATIGAGGSSTLSTTASFTSGTAPYTCQWLKKGPLDGSFGNFGSSFACIAGDEPTVSTGPLSTSGIWSFELQVSDRGSPSQAVTSSAASVTVNGALSAGAIEPGAAAIDAGQSITLTANAFGGVPPYSYQWYSHGTCTTAIVSATMSTFIASPTTTATYSYNVTDSNGAHQCSPGDTVTVNSALVAGAITPSAPTIDSSQSVTLAAGPSGGTAPYSYQWYSDSSCANAVPGATGSVLSVSPGVTTTYAYRLGDASQGIPATAQCSAGDIVTVNSALVVNPITPSNPTIDNGQSITLTSHASGGSPPISYQWYSDGTCGTSITGATLSAYNVTPTSTTTYSYKAADSAFSSVSQCSVGNTITVFPVLVVGAITPPTPSIDNGQSITLTAHPSGGATPYSYQWHSGSSATCAFDTTALGTAATQTVFPTANTYYCYTVTDATSSAQSSSTDLVSVNANLVAGTVTPPAPSIDSGQSITLTANPSGGTAPYHYQWYSSTNSACPSGTPLAATATLSGTPAISTYYCYTVTDSSTGNPTVSVTSAAFLITVNPALTAGAITPLGPSIDSGQSITLTSNPSGGTAPYQYQWYSGLSPTCSSDTILLGTASTQAVPPTLSTYYCYRVTDSSIGAPGASATSVTDLVVVSPALVAGAMTPSSPTIDNGQSIALTAKPSTGVSPYSYQWYSDGTCTTPIPSATSSTNTVSPASTSTYAYKVTDSAYSPASVCSPRNTVTVNPTLIAGQISPSNPTIDTGQSITLTSHTSGGTASLSYQWYLDGTCGASIQGATLSTYNTSPTATGTYSYKVTDSALSPASQCSVGDTVTIAPELVAGTITPSAPSIDNGQSITLTANPSGGATPFSYQWYSDVTCATAIQSATSSTLNVTPTATATYSYKVTDSANSPVSQCSVGNTISVHPTLVTGAPTPSSPTIDAGQSVMLASHAAGGTPSLSYQWYSDGSCTTLIPGATSPSYAAFPASTVSYSYKVTDSAYSQSSACSPSDTVTVNSELVAGAITPFSPTIDSGQSISLTTHASGGSPLLSYQWYSDGTCAAPIPGATSSNYAVSLLSTTIFSYRVTDSSQGSPAGTACSSAETVIVNLALAAGPITPPNPTINNGQPITLTATASGGTTPYSYQWYSAASCPSGSLISGETSSNLVASPASTTTYSYKVTDSAYLPVSRCSSGDIVKVNPTLAARSITPSNPIIDGGQLIFLTSQASGGTPAFSYQWYSDGACTTPIEGATSSIYPASPTATTTYSYNVTDSANPPASKCSPADIVTVNGELIAGAVAPSLAAIDNGQSIVLISNPSRGTVPYRYQWYSGVSASCSSDTTPLGTAATQVVSPTANTYYCYNLTDSSVGTPAASAISVTDLVIVNQGLAVSAPSSTPSAIDSAQSSTVLATFSGGTSPYTCQWLEKAPGTSNYINLGSPFTCLSSASTSTGPLPTAGSWSFELEVSDSSSSPAPFTSNAATVIVNAALSVPTISVNPTAVDLRQSSTLTTTTAFSGGTSPYVCQWLAKAPGAASYSNLGGPFSCNTGDKPTAPSGGLSTAGSWSFELKVSDSGSPSQSVSSAGVAVMVKRASPTIVANLSSSSIATGESVTDTGTVTGGYQAGGSVTYQFYSGIACTGTPTTVGSPVAITNGSVPNSASQKFSTAGSYSWTASYSGDNNNNPAVGNCQTLTVVTPPTLSVPGAQSVSAGSTIRFIVNATGAGGCNGVTLVSSSTLPAGATFGSTQCFAASASSVFLWTPTDSQAPGDYTVTFTATDTNHAATRSQVTIHVSPVSKAAALPIVSYSIIGVVGFIAVISVAFLLRRFQNPRRRSNP